MATNEITTGEFKNGFAVFVEREDGNREVMTRVDSQDAADDFVRQLVGGRPARSPRPPRPSAAAAPID